MHDSTPRSVLLALGTVQVLFALNYIATKWLLQTIPAPAWVCFRVGSAAILLATIAAFRHAHWTLTRGDAARLAVLSIFGIALNQILFIEGLARTEPSHSALINASIPVTTLLVAVLARRERLTARKGVALACALGGVLVLMSEQGFDWSSPTLRGDLLCLANATSFALFLVFSRPVMQRHSAWVTTPTLFAFGSLLVGSYGLDELVAVDAAMLPRWTWLVAAGVVLGPTIGTYGLNNWVLARAESSTVALFIYLQFVLAAPLSWALLGEQLSWRLVPAAALVFVGLSFSARTKRKRATQVGGPP